MNILTLKESRKRARQDARASEYKALIGRAVKATNQAAIPKTPAGELALLRRYIKNLEAALAELMAEFGKDADSAAWRLRSEKNQALEQVARLMAEAAKPAGM